MSDNGMKWYTIHVYSSMEKSVKKALEERIGRSDLRESFGQVLLPVERVQEVRNGRKYTSERRMYPGYVFIEMVMNDATWHLVNSTPRVIEFLGNNNPVVLSEAEVASIMAQMEQGSEKPRPKIEFEIGEEIRDLGLQGQLQKKGTPTTRAVSRSSCPFSAAKRWWTSTSTKSKKSKKILACRLHTDFFGGIVHAFLTHTWGAQAIERMNP